MSNIFCDHHLKTCVIASASASTSDVAWTRKNVTLSSFYSHADCRLSSLPLNIHITEIQLGTVL